MRKILILAFVTFLCFGLFASGSSENITVAMDIGSQEQIIINPYIVSDSNSVAIMQNLWDGLFEYDPETSQPKQALAESYSVSPDGKTWTFKIKKAKFSDGSEITSQTFADSWNYLSKGRLGSNINFIEKKSDSTLNLETPDKRTLVIHLAYPVSYLPSVLCQVSLAAINPFNSQIYSGAYTIDSIDSTKIVLFANGRYWDKVQTPQITILLGNNFTEDFNDGKIQYSLSWIEDATQYMKTSPVFGSSFFYFNSKTADVSSLSSCIPWNRIKEIIGDIIPSTSLVPESGAYFRTPAYNYNSEINQIKIGTYRGSNVNLACEVIQELWTNHFNATVLLDTVPVTVYSSKPSSNPYDFCLITWIADYLDPMAFLSMFESSASYNLANFSNKQYDALLELARKQTGEERLSTLKDAEQVLLDTGTVIPVSQAVTTSFVRDDLIEGWYSNPLDIHPFKFLIRK